MLCPDQEIPYQIGVPPAPGHRLIYKSRVPSALQAALPKADQRAPLERAGRDEQAQPIHPGHDRGETEDDERTTFLEKEGE